MLNEDKHGAIIALNITRSNLDTLRDRVSPFLEGDKKLESEFYSMLMAFRVIQDNLGRKIAGRGPASSLEGRSPPEP